MRTKEELYKYIGAEDSIYGYSHSYKKLNGFAFQRQRKDGKVASASSIEKLILEHISKS